MSWKPLLRRWLRKCLRTYGYTLRPLGEGARDARRTVAAATAAGLTVCEYLEKENARDNPRQQGRRDRVLAALSELQVLSDLRRVVEIGAGTGRHLEVLAERSDLELYEVYETDSEWICFLRETYGPRLLCHVPDGETLAATPDGVCRLVHAHAVFVYLPPVQTLSYVRDAGRVLAPGGYLVFDAFLGSRFDSTDLDAWLESEWRFPVLLPDAVLDAVAAAAGLSRIADFEEIYGPGRVSYLVYRKDGA